MASLRTIVTTAVLILTASPFVSAASDAPIVDLCSADKYPSPPYTPGKTTAPLVQVSTQQVLNSANPLYCSGTFLFVDGCTFTIKNFTFLNAYQSQWYAGVVGLVNGKVEVNQNAVTFVKDYVISVNGQDQTYHLTTAVGASYSFFSINQLRLFDTVEKQVVCTVDLPYNNPNVPGSSTDGSTSSNTANNGGAAAATTSKSGASGHYAGIIGAIIGALFV